MTRGSRRVVHLTRLHAHVRPARHRPAAPPAAQSTLAVPVLLPDPAGPPAAQPLPPARPAAFAALQLLLRCRPRRHNRLGRRHTVGLLPRPLRQHERHALHGVAPLLRRVPRPAALPPTPPAPARWPQDRHRACARCTAAAPQRMPPASRPCLQVEGAHGGWVVQLSKVEGHATSLRHLCRLNTSLPPHLPHLG